MFQRTSKSSSSSKLHRVLEKANFDNISRYNWKNTEHTEIDDNSHNWPKKREEWKSVFGRRVTILMSSGKTMCVAENALEVVDE